MKPTKEQIEAGMMQKELNAKLGEDNSGQLFALSFGVWIEVTDEMIEEGAQALVAWTDGAVWPDSWDDEQVCQARILARRCFVAMVLAQR